MTTTEKFHYQDTFIREVRATYHPTDKSPFLINDPEQAAEFVRSVLIDNSREHFVALFLDGAHQVASYSIVAIGTANSCQAHPREVLQRAILCGAISLIITHNQCPVHETGTSSRSCPRRRDRSASARTLRPHANRRRIRSGLVPGRTRVADERFASGKVSHAGRIAASGNAIGSTAESAPQSSPGR
jgi:hypothetical protein